MSQAWSILLALTVARLTMGFQFQSVPALASYFTASGLSFTALGTLTGAYLLPGVIVALAGGWLSRLLNDIRVLLTGIALMSVGGVVGWWSSSFELALAARLVAGAGAVCVNVFVTKMAAGWFAGRTDLPAAMGVLVSSWPAGLAIAALVLPVLANTFGFGLTQLIAPALCLMAFVLVLLVWKDPSAAPSGKSEGARDRFTPREWGRVILAGSIWGLYNIAFVGVIAWLPGFLSSEGLPEQKASALSSLIGWVAIFSVALGGWIAARLTKPDRVALGSFVFSAVLIFALTQVGIEYVQPRVMGLLGFAMGPAAAMIMTLPVAAARQSLQASAMGIYFALYYALMALGPPAMGRLLDATGDASAPLVVAAALMLSCTGLWTAFRLSAGRMEPAEKTA